MDIVEMLRHCGDSISNEAADTIENLRAEVKRLKWRLNHQTDDDVEECRQGKHEDCGA
jgi:hypothetical protein